MRQWTHEFKNWNRIQLRCEGSPVYELKAWWKLNTDPAEILVEKWRVQWKSLTANQSAVNGYWLWLCARGELEVVVKQSAANLGDTYKRCNELLTFITADVKHENYINIADIKWIYKVYWHDGWNDSFRTSKRLLTIMNQVVEMPNPDWQVLALARRRNLL